VAAKRPAVRAALAATSEDFFAKKRCVRRSNRSGFESRFTLERKRLRKRCSTAGNRGWGKCRIAFCFLRYNWVFFNKGRNWRGTKKATTPETRSRGLKTYLRMVLTQIL